MGHEFRAIGIPGIPLITRGDSMGTVIIRCCQVASIGIMTGDVLVVAQKVVSKAEGATINLTTIEPSEEAIQLGKTTGRDPRLCQVYLNESSEILRVAGRIVVTRHKLGFICTGSGVDRSNVAPHDAGVAVLLPRDPDASARRIRDAIRAQTGASVAVIISDSFGSRDRDGSVGRAIGIAGIHHLEIRDQHDLFGNETKSRIALVDELACVASVLMGQADESFPVVLIHGVIFTVDENACLRRILNP